jgi:hypothetical protein
LEKSHPGRLLREALSLDVQFGALDSAINSIPDETERRELASQLACVIGKIKDAFIRPIIRKYPGLDPDAP